MDTEVAYGLQELSIELLVDGGGEYVAPAIALADLTPQQASAGVDGAPYTILQLLAHMEHWQAKVLAAAHGHVVPRDDADDAGWPAAQPGQWNGLVLRFLDGQEQLHQLALSRPTMEREVGDGRTVGFMIASLSAHNAYHLGQIVLLRRLQGLWPPHGNGH